LKTLKRGNLNAGKTDISGTPVWQEDWNYDPTGNWRGATSAYVTKVNGSTTLDQNRSHDQANEILTLTGTPDWVDPTHDAAGNTTKVPQPAAPTSSYDCKFDAWDRLVEVKVTGGAVVSTLRYDGLKRRVTKVAGGNTRHYYYSSRWQVLEERLNALTTADRQPLLGVVYDPTRRELFSAVRGGGAFLDGRPLRVSGTAELVDAVVASGFPYDKHTNPDNNLREWAAFITRVRGERRLGSAALDLCYVAAGRLDGYWEKDLKPYDTMAGLLIAREAGGRVTGYRGEPEPQLADRGRYVASNGLLHAAMLEVLREAAG